MNTPSISISSDYAALDFKDGAFYYGYEVSVCTVCGERNKQSSEYCDAHPDAGSDWCFEAKFGADRFGSNGVVVLIPQSKLGTKDKFSVVDNLLTGIGWVLAKYELTIKL